MHGASMYWRKNEILLRRHLKTALESNFGLKTVDWSKVEDVRYITNEKKAGFAELHWYQADNIGKNRMHSKKVSGLKVRFLGEGSPMTLTHGNLYEVIAIEDDCYRIIDDTNEDYLYPIKKFEVVSD